MSRQTYIGLPVKDLAKATEFYTRLGFSYNRQASDDSSACMVVSDGTMVMLNVEPYFRQFTQSEIVDTSTAREVTLGLSADSREQVEDLVERAVAAGGRSLGGPVQRGPMYMRAFLDVDGHRWSVNCFDVPAPAAR
ncbi:MAG: VOC family protein [Mycobacteriales bacterium]